MTCSKRRQRLAVERQEASPHCSGRLIVPPLCAILDRSHWSLMAVFCEAKVFFFPLFLLVILSSRYVFFPRSYLREKLFSCLQAPGAVVELCYAEKKSITMLMQGKSC